MMAGMNSTERKVSVRIAGERAYEILVRPGLLADVGTWVAAHAKTAKTAKTAKAAVVSDLNVFSRHGRTVVESLDAAGIEPIVATLPPGEDHKTLSDLLPVYERILSARIERGTPVLALGGGVVGDMAGFLAATILRGVPLVQVPTTLLAMVDASVGGKTGVNSSAGKNLIGAFHQPIGVLIDPAVLATLAPAELRGGLAECIKHEVIRDADGFGKLEAGIGKALALDMDYLADLIAHNVAIKAKVVEGDPLEHGERAHLNFGHTFGHAIETVSRHSYSHGQCVALGMTAASYLAIKLGMMNQVERTRVVKLIQAAGLPTGGLKLSTADVVAAMGFDKKVCGGRIRFVLPQGIGRVVIRDDVPMEQVTAAVESLKGEPLGAA
jgi:3-dehydroquinate synthase